MALLTCSESTWLERPLYDEAEQAFHTFKEKVSNGQPAVFEKFTSQIEALQQSPKKKDFKSPISDEIAKAREHIRQTLNGVDFPVNTVSDVANKRIDELEKKVASLTSRLEKLEKFCKASCLDQSSNNITTAATCQSTSVPASSTALKECRKEEKEDDDDFELFGSDEEEEDEAVQRIKQERLEAYEAKKNKKPTVIAKSNVIFDVKPWDDETDMAKLEECVRSVNMDGLLWGASKLVPLAYGIKKLQITCVVEDEKVSTEELEEKLLEFEDYIQSVDIAAFNKI